jgi:glycine/betaine/sarcosine/D-proline reductase family selenoprotein B
MSEPKVNGRFVDDDAPITYMQRTRDYYLALGYDNPYRWAHYKDVPFTRLKVPLARARVGIVTTAAPYQPDKGDQGPGAAYNSAAKFYKVYSGESAAAYDLRISHIGYDRIHTRATDQRCWFPLDALKTAQKQGRIGAVARHYFGLPTNRSQATTIDIDAPEVVTRCLSDKLDAVLVVPNCPVCHQVAAITARQLESAGIPTVVMGCAKDIVERCGVSRFLFSDFPLGNACGRPHDEASQAETLELALKLLESAPGPRTTLQSPLRWSDNADWKLDHLNLDRMSAEEVARRRAENDRQKAIAKAIRADAGLVKAG